MSGPGGMFDLSASASDAGGGLLGGLGGIASLLTGGLSSLFAPTAPSGGGGGSGGGEEPYTTAGGPFGIGSHTIPGLTAAPPTPTYAPTLQFGPIPAMAQTNSMPLTPLTPMAPLPGPSMGGMSMGGGGSMPSMGGGAPGQVVTPGMSAGGGPMPQQTPYMPQMSQQQMPFMAPDGSVQSPQQSQPAAAPYPASPMAQPQQMAPWQQAAMSQLQQSGISPASMSQALMPTALAYTEQPQGQTAQANGLVPPPPPYIPTVGGNGQVQSPQGQPPQGGIVNLIGAAAAYPQMLSSNLQGAMDNVNAFNTALKEGSKQIEGAAEVVKQGILGPAQKEVEDELGKPQFAATGADGQPKEMTLPEYRKMLRGAIQAINEDVDKLQGQYQNVGTDKEDTDRGHEEAEAFASGFPKAQRGGLMKMLEHGFEMSNIATSKGAIAQTIAMKQNQQATLQAQADKLDARVDAVRNRYQRTAEVANQAAQHMRDSYYKSADTMLSGVKGINELQAQTLRAYIADKHAEGQIEQMQQQNALTAAKIGHEADMKGMELQEKAAEAGQKGYQEAMKQKTQLVGDAIKKMKPSSAADLAKAMKQLMDTIDINPVPPAGAITEAKK
jgi:hypothetical protein